MRSVSSSVSWRRLLTWRWLILHVIALALSVTMVLLGRWQLDVSDSKHFDLQNFGYALQWWAFTAFALAMWVRIMRDGLRRAAGEPHSADPGSQEAEPVSGDGKPIAYRRYVMPTPAAPGDAEHASYNDYLARLNRDAERKNAQ